MLDRVLIIKRFEEFENLKLDALVAPAQHQRGQVAEEGESLLFLGCRFEEIH